MKVYSIYGYPLHDYYNVLVTLFVMSNLDLDFPLVGSLISKKSLPTKRYYMDGFLKAFFVQSNTTGDSVWRKVSTCVFYTWSFSQTSRSARSSQESLYG